MKNINFKIKTPSMDRRKIIVSALAGIGIFILVALNVMVVLGKTGTLDSMVQAVVPGKDKVNVRMGVYTGAGQQAAADDAQKEDQNVGAEAENVPESTTQEETVPETEARITKMISHYEFVKSDASWYEAYQAAQDAGGHLAVITSEEEFNEICEIAYSADVTYIWLGANITSVDDDWKEHWITGEEWTFDRWYPNEPSKIDSSDDAEEFCLCLWNAKYDGDDIGWTFNDQRNNLAGELSSASGRLGYIIEYEEEVEVEEGMSY